MKNVLSYNIDLLFQGKKIEMLISWTVRANARK